MKSIQQFFNYLHDVDFPYVVLRNFENLPHSIISGTHGDLDILVYDRNHFREIIPEAKLVHPEPRVVHKLNIDGLNIYLDVRYVGDRYYPTNFEQAILNTREYNVRGFYTPNPIHFRLALAYHAVHHKNANSYENWLGKASVEELAEALKGSRIGYAIPKDTTVGSFNQYWKGATSIVSKTEGSVRKSQTNFNDYNLIDNEYRILTQVCGSHFPTAYSCKDGAIDIEDCGERLTSDTLPTDWRSQLIEIVNNLETSKVVHRDIKPDNLMVKDGIIKLIDFGWSRFMDDEEDSPPECLGYPYRSSWGFDDNFSMRKVMREFEYQLSVKEVVV